MVGRRISTDKLEAKAAEQKSQSAFGSKTSWTVSRTSHHNYNQQLKLTAKHHCKQTET